jgi:hypothetical protein
MVNIPGRCYSRLQRVLVPNAMKTAKHIDLVFVYSVYDFACEKIPALAARSFRQTAKQPGMFS